MAILTTARVTVPAKAGNLWRGCACTLPTASGSFHFNIHQAWGSTLSRLNPQPEEPGTTHFLTPTLSWFYLTGNSKCTASDLDGLQADEFCQGKKS